MEIISSKCFRRGQAFKGFTLNCNELLLQLYSSGHTTLLLSYYNHTPDTILQLYLKSNYSTTILDTLTHFLKFNCIYSIALFTSSVTEGFTFTHTHIEFPLKQPKPQGRQGEKKSQISPLSWRVSVRAI